MGSKDVVMPCSMICTVVTIFGKCLMYVQCRLDFLFHDQSQMGGIYIPRGCVELSFNVTVFPSPRAIM